MAKRLEIYQDSEKAHYVIERVNEFSHSTKRFYENMEELYDGIDTYKDMKDVDDYEIVVTDNSLYSKIIRYMGFNIREKETIVGRPAIGVTKKVSLTLSEDNWEWLDEKAEGNRSKFLREVVWNALGNESEWSNYACFGYAISAARKIGLEDEKIQELVKALYGEFDFKSVSEAEDIYRNSDY